MEAKVIRVIDNMTDISAIAVRATQPLDVAEAEGQRAALARVGWGVSAEEQREFIVLLKAAEGYAHFTPYVWNNSNTMRIAHHVLVDRWDEIKNGDTLDVRPYYDATYAYVAGGLR